LGCSSGAKLVKNWVVLHEVFKSTFWLRFLLFWKHEDCYIARRCGSISRKEFSQYLASKIHCKLENENVTFSLSLGRHIFGALSQPDSCNNWGSVNLYSTIIQISSKGMQKKKFKKKKALSIKRKLKQKHD